MVPDCHRFRKCANSIFADCVMLQWLEILYKEEYICCWYNLATTKIVNIFNWIKNHTFNSSHPWLVTTPHAAIMVRNAALASIWVSCSLPYKCIPYSFSNDIQGTNKTLIDVGSHSTLKIYQYTPLWPRHVC